MILMGMGVKTFAYACLILVLILFLTFLLVYLINSDNQKIKYYKYRVFYEEDLSKYYAILKKQKIVILKKRINLMWLKLLLKIKGVS